MTRVAVDVWVRVGLPPLAVTVKRYEPGGVLEAVLTVSVDELPRVELGLKLPRVPAGRPLIEK